VDEPVDLLVNNKLIARGDIVVVDEKYGLRITEIISPRERIESLR
jgi:flagellar motor switch protein FliN/FliY